MLCPCFFVAKGWKINYNLNQEIVDILGNHRFCCCLFFVRTCQLPFQVLWKKVISKESIFSDLNNLEVVTATSEKYETALVLQRRLV